VALRDNDRRDRQMSNRGAILRQLREFAGWRQASGPLFCKYVALFLVVVCIALLSNGAFELWFSSQEQESLRHPHPKRAGGGASQDQSVRQGNRTPNRVDDRIALID
jgi:hypothetical protein